MQKKASFLSFKVREWCGFQVGKRRALGLQEELLLVFRDNDKARFFRLF